MSKKPRSKSRSPSPKRPTLFKDLLRSPEKRQKVIINFDTTATISSAEKEDEDVKNDSLLLSGVGNIRKMVKDDIIIYLFSDETHSFKHSCIKTKNMFTIDKFIDIVIKENKNFTDLFLEYHPTDKETTDSFLSQTIDFFHKNKLKYKNARIHYTDLRVYNKDSFYNRYLNAKDKKDKNIIIDELITFYNTGLWNFETYIYNTIEKIPLLKKELNRMDIKQQKFLINSVKDSTLKDFGINKIKPFNFNIERKHHVDILILADTFVMDLYLLARLFKNRLEFAKNSIIYAGEFHINIYYDYLIKMGFVNVETARKISKSCVDISNMKMPFFT